MWMLNPFFLHQSHLYRITMLFGCIREIIKKAREWLKVDENVFLYVVGRKESERTGCLICFVLMKTDPIGSGV